MSAGMRLLNKKDEARRVATGFNEEKSDKETIVSPRPRGVSYATLPGSVYPIEESDYGASSESSYPAEERKPDLLARYVIYRQSHGNNAAFIPFYSTHKILHL